MANSKITVDYNTMLNPDGTPKYKVTPTSGTILGAAAPSYAEGIPTVNSPIVFNGNATAPMINAPSSSTLVTPDPPKYSAVGTPNGGGGSSSVPGYYDYRTTVPSDVKDLYTDDIINTDSENKQIADEINNSGTGTGTSHLSYADQVLADTLGLNDTQYNYLIKSINNAKETGLALAEDVRSLLLQVSGDLRSQLYKAAESARKREEERAEIERQRGIYDASNAYEQNKATYGANAEALASMGLTGGGYSDYLNAKAYATQRGEVQAANAGAEAAKRAARYAEDESRNKADISYAEAASKAAAKYAEDVSSITTKYQDNLDKAELWKIEADAEANATYRDNVQKYKDTMFEDLLEEVNKGNYSAEELKPIIENLGFSDDQINMLNNAASKYSEKESAEKKDLQYQNYQRISAAIKENPDSYSDADIDRAVAEEAISAEDGELLKKEKVTSKTTLDAEELEYNIYSYIEAGDIAGATANADKLKAEGKIGDTTYKQAYHDAWKATLDAQTITADNIDSALRDIRSDKDSGKLSEEKANELIKHAWSTLGKTYTREQAGISNITHLKHPLPHTELDINGVSYENNLRGALNDSTKALLNGIATGDRKGTPKEGTIVEYNGKKYAYMEYADASSSWPTLSPTPDTIIGWVELVKS